MSLLPLSTSVSVGPDSNDLTHKVCSASNTADPESSGIVCCVDGQMLRQGWVLCDATENWQELPKMLVTAMKGLMSTCSSYCQSFAAATVMVE